MELEIKANEVAKQKLLREQCLLTLEEKAAWKTSSRVLRMP